MPAHAQPRPTPGYPLRRVTHVEPSFVPTPGATRHRDEVWLTVSAVGHSPCGARDGQGWAELLAHGQRVPSMAGAAGAWLPQRAGLLSDI